MKWSRRIKLLRVSKFVIAIAAALSAIFAAFTIYGNQVGNFVVSAGNQGDIKLGLTLDPEMADVSNRLTISGLDNQRDATYSYIPNDIYQGIGDKNDYRRNNYIAYSFYLVNLGESAVDYTVSLNVVDVYHNPLDILRVMMIVGEDDVRNIYAKPEATQEGVDRLQQNTDYTTIDFVSDSVLLHMQEYDLQPQQMVKYTIVLWLEGWDIECVDQALGGRAKLALDFVGM